MNRGKVFTIIICVFGIVTSGVVLSILGVHSHLLAEYQVVMYKICLLAVALFLMLVVDNALVEKMRSTVSQFHKNQVVSVFMERTFENGRYLNILGLTITFLCWVIKVFFSIQATNCFLVILITIGIILYTVGITLILLIDTSIGAKNPIQ